MARYTGPVCRLCRTEGEKLFLKGDRCFTNKCAWDKRKTAPGMLSKRRSKDTEYRIQLREKQKIRKNSLANASTILTFFSNAQRTKMKHNCDDDK